MMKKLLTILLYFFPTLLFANPAGLMIINKPQYLQEIWIIRNISAETILINHEKQKPGAGAGWASQLSSHAYSALMLDHPNFSLTCQTYSSGAYLDCNQVLQIVGMHNEAKFADQSPHGTYWLAENTHLFAILFHLRLLGFWVPNS
jgi:hypothetical protein